MFKEKASGAKTDRVQLRRAFASLGKGDVLHVTRLDRLARSTRGLLDTLDAIAKAGVGFRSLADAWYDTTTRRGRSMLTVLDGLAEFERELIRARTSEGRSRAKARGIHMGRPPAFTRRQREEALHDLATGKATQTDSRGG
ncbi:MAG: recombinase family protein [Methylocystis sp.]